MLLVIYIFFLLNNLISIVTPEHTKHQELLTETVHESQKCVGVAVEGRGGGGGLASRVGVGRGGRRDIQGHESFVRSFSASVIRMYSTGM